MRARVFEFGLSTDKLMIRPKVSFDVRLGTLAYDVVVWVELSGW